jgi:hypothetical protein
LVVRADAIPIPAPAPPRAANRSLKKPLEPLAGVAPLSTQREAVASQLEMSGLRLDQRKGPAFSSQRFTSQASRGNHESHADTERSGQPQVAAKKTISNLISRLRIMEEHTAAKSRELIEKRDQMQEVQQQLFIANGTIASLEARLQLHTREVQANRGEVDAALKLVTRLSFENERLKALMAHASRAVSSTIAADKIMKMAGEESEAAVSGELRNRMLLYSVRGVADSVHLKSLAARHALAIAKWEGKRRMLIEWQRRQAISVLAAMDLLRKDLMVAEVGIVQNEPGFKVTSVKFVSQPERTQNEPRNKGRTWDGARRVGKNSSLPTIDEAVVTANAHVQTLGRSLQAGLVSTPIAVET